MTLDHSDPRISHLEAALLSLHDRVNELERSLGFEVRQRQAMEQLVLDLSPLPNRMDHVEGEIMKLRRSARGRRDIAA